VSAKRVSRHSIDQVIGVPAARGTPNEVVPAQAGVFAGKPASAIPEARPSGLQIVTPANRQNANSSTPPADDSVLPSSEVSPGRACLPSPKLLST
jgi:hypothetical protein